MHWNPEAGAATRGSGRSPGTPTSSTWLARRGDVLLRGRRGEPRGARRRPARDPQVDAGDGRRTALRAAPPAPARLLGPGARAVRDVPARAHRARPWTRRWARRGPRAASTSSRRSAPTSRSGSSSACSACPTTTPGSSSAGATGWWATPTPTRPTSCSTPRRASSTATCPSARPPRSRSSPTATSSPGSARGGDGEDLVSKLVNRVPEDGIALSERDFHNYFLLLVVAGNETTRHTITHSMKALIDHPEAFATLKERPELLPKAVEEFLRWASPVYHFRRTATTDVELHGRTITAGDKVVMWWASGNRDDDRLRRPVPLRRRARRPRAHGLRQGRTAPVPGQPAGPHGDPHHVRGDPSPGRLRRAARARPKRVRSNFVNGFKEFWVRRCRRVVVPGLTSARALLVEHDAVHPPRSRRARRSRRAATRSTRRARRPRGPVPLPRRRPRVPRPAGVGPRRPDGAPWSADDHATIGSWLAARAGHAADGARRGGCRARHLLRRAGDVGRPRRGRDPRAGLGDRLDGRSSPRDPALVPAGAVVPVPQGRHGAAAGCPRDRRRTGAHSAPRRGRWAGPWPCSSTPR